MADTLFDLGPPTAARVEVVHPASWLRLLRAAERVIREAPWLEPCISPVAGPTLLTATYGTEIGNGPPLVSLPLDGPRALAAVARLGARVDWTLAEGHEDLGPVMRAAGVVDGIPVEVWTPTP